MSLTWARIHILRPGSYDVAHTNGLDRTQGAHCWAVNLRCLCADYQELRSIYTNLVGFIPFLCSEQSIEQLLGQSVLLFGLLDKVGFAGILRMGFMIDARNVGFVFEMACERFCPKGLDLSRLEQVQLSRQRPLGRHNKLPRSTSTQASRLDF